MQIGEYYRVRPVFSVDKVDTGRYMIGKVVYIHPQQRYGVLEFRGAAGTVREAFWPEELATENMVSERRAKRYEKRLAL